MKPIRHSLPLLLLGASLGIPGGFGQAPRPEPMQGVSRGQPKPPGPTLVISVNEVAGGIGEPGWPLIVSATKLPDDRFANVAMPADFRLKLEAEGGGDVPVALTPVPAPPDDTSSVRYWLAGDTRLPPGRFRVTTVPGQPALSAWEIEMGSLQIVAPDPAHTRLLALVRAHRAVLLDRVDEALAEVERLIAADAGDQGAWIAKGDLLMRRDRPDEALAAFDTALSLHQKSHREPLALQFRRRSALLRSLEKRGVATPPAPP